jgi:DNA modification methylase
MSIRIITGDALEQLRLLPAESVHCCVTSPPYYGLRDYGCAGQIGLEPSPDAYVAALVAVFREVRRVLRRDGTLWLNIGDSYAGASIGWRAGNPDKNGGNSNRNGAGLIAGMKPKDLLGIPWMLAFALRADGWWLRQDIIWSKPNPMPESVTDRCTKAHEYLFLLSKSERYWFDHAAIAEAAAEPSSSMPAGARKAEQSAAGIVDQRTAAGFARGVAWGETRNKRSVWTVASEPFPEAHFATFPPALIEPCILAGSPEKCCAKCGSPWHREGGDLRPFCDCPWDYTEQSVVLDPFGGAGTTGMVADRLGRDAILIELNPAYAAMARRRIEDDAGLFAQVEAAD